MLQVFLYVCNSTHPALYEDNNVQRIEPNVQQKDNAIMHNIKHPIEGKSMKKRTKMTQKNKD